MDGIGANLRAKLSLKTAAALLLLAVIALAPGAFAYPATAPVASMESAPTHSTHSMHSTDSTDMTQGSVHACCDQHEGGTCPADMNCNLSCAAFSGLFAVLPETCSSEKTQKMRDPIRAGWNLDGRLIAQNTPPPRS